MKFKVIINEEYLLEDIASVRKYYPEIDDETFNTILTLDPTFNPNKDKLGSYGRWLLDRFKKNDYTTDDFEEVKETLTAFEENKKNLAVKDIGKYKTIDEIQTALQDEASYEVKSHRQEVRQRQKQRKYADLGKEAELAYEDDKWEVWIPHTYPASCKLGQGTVWCTASTENDSYYKRYKQVYGGEYYIIIDKDNEDVKYQFHFESNQFMDKDNYPIDLEYFLEKTATPGMAEFFNEIMSKESGIDELEENNIISVSLYDSLYGNNDDSLEDLLVNWNDRYSSGRDSLSPRFVLDMLRGEGMGYFMDIGYSADPDDSCIDELSERMLNMLNEEGFDKDSLKRLLKEDENEDDEKNKWFEGVQDALTGAYADAVDTGTEYEALKDIVAYMGYPEGDGWSSNYSTEENKLEIEFTKSSAKKIMEKLGMDLYGMDFNSRFKGYTPIQLAVLDEYISELTLREPRYGWYGFNQIAFEESLRDRLPFRQ